MWAELKTIKKTVYMSGEPVEIYMREMLKPCTQEELDKMSVEERENYKYLPPLNNRTYIAEDGIECMQDVPVKMRDGITIYADIYKPVGEGKYPLIISGVFMENDPLKDKVSGKSWVFRLKQFPICLSSKVCTQVIGVVADMPLPMWILEVSDIQREILFSLVLRMHKMDMILLNGLQSNLGVTEELEWPETVA